MTFIAQAVEVHSRARCVGARVFDEQVERFIAPFARRQRAGIGEACRGRHRTTDDVVEIRALYRCATFFNRVATGTAAELTFAICQVCGCEQQAIVDRAGFLDNDFATAFPLNCRPVDRVGNVFLVERNGMRRDKNMAEFHDHDDDQHTADQYARNLVPEEIAHGRPQLIRQLKFARV